MYIQVYIQVYFIFFKIQVFNLLYLILIYTPYISFFLLFILIFTFYHLFPSPMQHLNSNQFEVLQSLSMAHDMAWYNDKYAKQNSKHKRKIGNTTKFVFLCCCSCGCCQQSSIISTHSHTHTQVYVLDTYM